jgi:hypothetical protein
MLSNSSFWREPPISIYLNLFGVALHEAWHLVLPISKPFIYNFSTFFQIQKLRSPIQKLGLVSRTHYTLPNAKNCMRAKFYNKLKKGFM